MNVPGAPAAPAGPAASGDRPGTRPAPYAIVAVAAGAALGFVYTLSPMAVWFCVGSFVLVWCGGRGLPARERRWIMGVLIGALALRAAILAALFLLGTPDVQASFSVFFGDEQYMLIRALRQRSLWLGLPMRSDAFTDIFELYGRTSYLNVIAYLQLLLGPSPYGVRLLNVLFYVTGAVVLHRMVRRAYGRVPALGGLVLLLFLPSLVVWSASALKESLSFLVVVCTLGAAIAMVRAAWKWRPLAAVAVAAGGVVLQTFRVGAFEIAALGLGVGFLCWLLTLRRWLAVLALVTAVALAGPALRNPRVQAAALAQLRPVAKMHMGHALTRGHSYELVDDAFYGHRPLATMTFEEAAQFAGRGIASVLLFPIPMDLRSRSELAYLPEQLVWYVMLFTAGVGFVAGLRWDALTTSLFSGYAAVALAVVGLGTGNIGTLVRHRAFALPFVSVLAALGITVLLSRFCAADQD